MRRSLAASATLPRQDRSPDCETQSHAEYVINWPAIGASFALLLVLVAVPAALFAWRPDWFGFSHRSPGADAAPLIVAVESSIQEAPAVEPNPVLEELRLRQLREAERAAVDRSDSTRRILRARPTPPAEPASETKESQVSAGKPMELPVIAQNLRPAAADEPPSTVRLNRLSAEDLLKQLRVDVPELRLDDKGELSAKIVAAAKGAKNKGSKDVSTKDALPDSSLLRKLVAERADFAGLPFRWDGACKIEGKRLDALKQVSTAARDLRLSFFQSFDFRSSEREVNQAYLALCAVKNSIEEREWNTPEHVPAMEQTLQTAGPPLSWAFVEACGKIKGPVATQALARRALYDISPDVRAAAVYALMHCQPEDYQSTLVEGFRYPWPAVAMNAADALVALGEEDVVPQLEQLVDMPPPAAPRRDEQGRWVVRELVKVNHLRNCTVCHAPLTGDRGGKLSGFIPTPGQPLPAAYYAERKGDFVRADVTYLRQDFSVMQQVRKADPWPALQRFDFLVRTRVLPPEEQECLNRLPPAESESPQRDALLYALRKLKGQDSPPKQTASSAP